MGKSGKKTKSDRINALRKQYDAFLNEDKKRKDRNEFILGRLEKMRLHTPALLPVRHNMEVLQPFQCINQERDNQLLCSRSRDVLSDCVLKEEQRILQEISKKYILIPKIQSKNEVIAPYYNTSSVSNDTDWRKKYNILDDLKKIEKEGEAEVSKDINNITDDKHNGTSINRANNYLDLHNIATSEHTNDLNTMNTQPNNDYVPVKELHTDSTTTVLSNGNHHSMEPKKVIEKKQEKFDTLLTYSPKKQDFSNVNELNEDLYPSENTVDSNAENFDYIQAQDVQQNQMKDMHNIIQIKADTLNETADNIINEPVSQNNTVEPINVTVNDPSIMVTDEQESNNNNLETGEIRVHSKENIENLEACASIEQIKPVLDNVQPLEYAPTDARIDENIIPSQIDEFEAEQKEMFYSEETEYNQNVDTMGYNTQNEEYVNEQYSYYNESQQEQPYYAGVNEHEESTERYDPNYEQQYSENYQENVNVAHYENQPYAEGYENEPVVTNLNYEQPDQQEITNVNYEDQPDPSELNNINYIQQPADYGYEQPANDDQSQIENVAYNPEVNEPVNYDTQEYNESEDKNLIIPNEIDIDSQQNYVQIHANEEAMQNLEQQLDGEDGYAEIQNTYPSEHNTAVENADVIDSNIKAT